MTIWDDAPMVIEWLGNENLKDTKQHHRSSLPTPAVLKTHMVTKVEKEK